MKKKSHHLRAMIKIKGLILPPPPSLMTSSYAPDKYKYPINLVMTLLIQLSQEQSPQESAEEEDGFQPPTQGPVH